MAQACCPLPIATCCGDVEGHCCPGDRECDLTSMTCLSRNNVSNTLLALRAPMADLAAVPVAPRCAVWLPMKSCVAWLMSTLSAPPRRSVARIPVKPCCVALPPTLRFVPDAVILRVWPLPIHGSCNLQAMCPPPSLSRGDLINKRRARVALPRQWLWVYG